MPLSGSQLAYKQARSGIARAGASRANYYTPNVVITINGTDRTSSVILESLGVDLNVNDQPDEAVFQLKPSPGFTPTVGQTVKVGLGTSANLEFAGQILMISHRREMAHPPTRTFMAIRCTDWNRLFDRRLITKRWDGVSATSVVNEIISSYASGFTNYRVETGLGNVTDFVCINERPMAALRRLAALVGGFFYIDPDRDVHFWVTADPGQSSPRTLSETATTLQSFDAEYDYSQIRSQIIAEGRSQEIMIDVPAGEVSVPIRAGWGFSTSGISAPPLYASVRVGSTLNGYIEVSHIIGPPAAVVTTNAAVGDTSIALDRVTDFSTAVVQGVGWGHDSGGNLFSFTTVTGGGSPSISGIPASGYGSITNAIPAGTPIYCQDSIYLAAAFTDDLTQGDTITYRLMVDGTSEQSAIAAIEGGDGIHQYVIAEDSWEAGGIATAGDQAAVAGQAELDLFGAAIRFARWVTRDLNAKPGRSQVINFSSPAYSDTLTITRVSLRWYKQNHRPVRSCEARTVKVAGVMDALAPASIN